MTNNVLFAQYQLIYILVNMIILTLGLDNVRINWRDGPFSSDIEIVNLHPSKGTHWVVYMNENYFDSYACPPPKTYLG